MNQKVAPLLAPCLMSAIVFCILPVTALADSNYSQDNLVSDIPGFAAVTDPNLVNPWGISFSAISPFSVSDNGTNVSTLYSANGTPASLVVTVPGGPTGQVFNSAAGDFLDGSTAASFLFATLNGSIYAWNSGNGTAAQFEAATPGGQFTGLAFDNNATGNFLYVANDAGSGGIEVFNSSFIPTTFAGSFTDPNLPAGYVPYNIQTINGNLYVEYTNTANPRALGSGAVSVFDANGNFIQELISPGGQLDDPWGVVIAPSGFGSFSNDLLVGNFGNGEINAYNPTTGAYLGTLDAAGGTPIVNQDLWALAVSPSGGNAVYFTAGIDAQQEGLFGDITVVPEPSSLALVGVGCLALVQFSRRRRTPLTRV